MKSLEAVKNNVALKNHLVKNKLLKSDVKKLICFITPYITMVGLLCGRVTMGAHIVEKRCSKNEYYILMC